MGNEARRAKVSRVRCGDDDGVKIKVISDEENFNEWM